MTPEEWDRHVEDALTIANPVVRFKWCEPCRTVIRFATQSDVVRHVLTHYDEHADDFAAWEDEVRS